MRLVFLALMLVAATGCARFPEVTTAMAEDRSEKFPKLVPIEPLLAEDEERLDETSEDDLNARADRLKRKADALKIKKVE